ncbi:hypothetical protein [Domibacillus robiginosus]|uniref:hypothetical protein n=1 Tax=Domibacillus robiginosus TaxID=1071054 RepID=UPI00067AD5BA|nr:hypothetical protein [Domibacillus robiginosus]
MEHFLVIKGTDLDTGMLEKTADLYDVSIDYLLSRSNTEKYEVNDEKEMIAFFKNPELNFFFWAFLQFQKISCRDLSIKLCRVPSFFVGK